MWFFGRKPEQENERHTGGIVAIVHQREQAVYEPPPDPLPAGALMRQWAATHPRGNTEGIHRVERDSRAWADVPTVKKLQKPDWLMAKIPQGLEVQKPAVSAPAPCPQPVTPLPDDPLGFAELPTWIVPETIESRISAALPPAPDDDAWLNDAHPGPMPTQEAWDRRLAEIATPPVLAPLPEDAIAATDRTAGNVEYVQVWCEPEQQTGALERLAELAKRKPDDSTAEVPAIMRQKHMNRESE